MTTKAMKALDDNFMNMMMAKIGNDITDSCTNDSIDELNDLMAKKESVEALEKKCTALEVECATLKERLSVHANAATQESTTAKELLAAKIECATYKAACAEKDKTFAIQQEQLKKLTEQMEKPEPMEAESPEGYDIDVMRGGDDRIRSLRVRYT